MKKNISLILGISIPIIMILFVAGSIYLPGLFIKPKYNFLYVTDGPYYGSYSYRYTVANGKLMKIEPNNPNAIQNKQLVQDEEKIYVYDVSKNEGREISFDEAQSFTLNSNPTSPDGFEIVNGNSENGFFPFFFWSGTDYGSRYLKGHNVSRKLNITLNYSYSYNFRLIGWIQ